MIRRLRRRLYWWWEAWAWRRWAKGKRERCPMCIRMTTAEWFAMCDCWSTHRYLKDTPWPQERREPPWDDPEADPIEDVRKAWRDIRDAPIRPQYYGPEVLPYIDPERKE